MIRSQHHAVAELYFGTSPLWDLYVQQHTGDHDRPGEAQTWTGFRTRYGAFGEDVVPQVQTCLTCEMFCQRLLRRTYVCPEVKEMCILSIHVTKGSHAGSHGITPP